MKTLFAAFSVATLTLWPFPTPARAGPDAAAWEPQGAVDFPDVKSGPYSDYVTTDPERHRVFTTMQASHEVVVSDYETRTVIATIPGFGNPHGVVYRADTDRLYVSDGAGKVDIFDGTHFTHLKSIALRAGVDGIVVDPGDKRRIYVANGGDDAGDPHAHLTVIDTDRDSVAGDIVFDTPVLEQGVIDHDGGALYLNLPLKASVAIVDLHSLRVTGQRKVPSCAKNMSIALARPWGRLFVACRTDSMHGTIVALDLANKAPPTVLPAHGWIDSLWLDNGRRRLIASSGDGFVETWRYAPDGTFRKYADTDTSIMAKTSYFDPVADRLFVSVPHLGFPTDYARVLVFSPAR